MSQTPGIPFSKLHGCGNDYIFIDEYAAPVVADPAALARAMSDRHRGVGSDGLILLQPPISDRAQVRMRMFNADGSESEMCGNGLRCLAAFARRRGVVSADAFAVDTGAGVLAVQFMGSQGLRSEVQVAMGHPRLSPAAVPVQHPGPGPLLALELALSPGPTLRGLAVGMGNPHCVIMVADAEAVPLAAWGPQLEHHSAFPRRTNVEFVSLLPSSEGGVPCLRQRTWERGSGITQACGTGACAVAVAAMIDGLIDGRRATVVLDGGRLDIHWDGEEGVIMSGEAVMVCDGHWPTDGP